MLISIDNWRVRAEEIAEHAVPVTGNKGRALSLARDLLQAKISLTRLVGKPDGD